MADALPLLQSIAEALDSLGLATCVLDSADCALLWNRTFLKLFPEHAARIHVGESYRANLRRFYEKRLGSDEMPAIDRYIDEGVARHRAQQQPFVFEHRGVRLRVASLPLPGIGRIRIWQPEASREPGAGECGPPLPDAPPIDGTALFDHVADGVMVTGADGRIVWVNEPFVVMYRFRDRAAAVGVDLEEAYRTAWHGLEAKEPARFAQGLVILAEHMRFAGAPFEVPLPEARCTRVVEQRSPDGRSFFMHVDITQLKRQQHQLLLAERRARESEALLKTKSALLEATLERMEQGVMMVNAERIVEVCNRRAIELLGLPEALMASKPTFEAVLAYQWSTAEFVHTPQDILDFVRSGGILDRPHCYDRKRPDGRVIEIQSVPIQGGGVLRTYTDITDRRRSEEHLLHVARHDGLTALVNRSVFLERLAEAVRAAGPEGAGFAVHYIDLNRFKPVNDRLGHAVGDQVLARVAERMRQIARDGDVVARMGGDEFAVLQCHVAVAADGLGLAQRLLQGIAQPMEVESHHLQVGASIGIAIYPAAGGDADTLLRHADAAMYAAKASGRDCARVFGAGDEAPARAAQ